jgi:hypothetical protein
MRYLLTMCIAVVGWTNVCAGWRLTTQGGFTAWATCYCAGPTLY